MNTRELEYFIKIADTKNLTIAADQLYVTQPTLSKYLDRLESEIGMDLFERINREMRLTYAGERYLHYAKTILGIKHDLDMEMKKIQEQNIGVLRVGFPSVRSSLTLPEILPAYKEKYPNIQIEITSEPSQILDNKLKEGKIDLAFYIGPKEQEDFTYDVISNERLVLLLPEKDKKEPFSTISIKDLAYEHFIIPPRSTRHGVWVRDVIKEYGIEDYLENENQNILTTAILANNGYGYAFFSDVILSKLHYKYCYVRELDQEMNFVVAYRKTSQLPDYIQYFIDCVKENEK